MTSANQHNCLYSLQNIQQKPFSLPTFSTSKETMIFKMLCLCLVPCPGINDHTTPVLFSCSPLMKDISILSIRLAVLVSLMALYFCEHFLELLSRGIKHRTTWIPVYQQINNCAQNSSRDEAEHHQGTWTKEMTRQDNLILNGSSLWAMPTWKLHTSVP